MEPTLQQVERYMTINAEGNLPSNMRKGAQRWGCKVSDIMAVVGHNAKLQPTSQALTYTTASNITAPGTV